MTTQPRAHWLLSERVFFRPPKVENNTICECAAESEQSQCVDAMEDVSQRAAHKTSQDQIQNFFLFFPLCKV